MTASAEQLLPGGGECGALIRAFDWTRTPLGPLHSWPVSLLTLVRTLLRSRHPMFLFWGPDLIQLYNDAFALSLDASKHPGAIGQRGAECWPETWAQIHPQIRDAMDHGKASWNEEQLLPIQRNGRLEDVYWTYSYSPAFDDTGGIGGVLVTCAEVTAQVLARRELETARRAAEQAREDLRAERRKAELASARLHQMFESAPVFITLLRGPEHVFELANPAYARLVGGRPLLGRKVREAFPEVEGQGFFELLDDVYRTGQPFIGNELPILFRQPGQAAGHQAFVTFTYEPFRDPSGVVDGVICFGFEVTDMVRARQRIEQLAQDEARARVRAEAVVEALERAVRERRTLTETIEQSNEFVGYARPDGVAEWVNAPGLRLVGLSGQLPIARRPILDYFPEDLRPRVREEVLPAISRTGRWQGELAFQHFVTGERIPVWYSAFLVRDPSGAVVAIATVTRDIREQKAREAERAAMLEREQSLRLAAEAANRARDEFLAMLGHELRNPLAPIATATQLMRMRGDQHRTERLVIERQVQHLSRLVDDLLDVARIARGKIDLQRESIEAAEVAAKAIEQASPLLEQREQHFSLQVPPEGLLVDGDPVRLAQVLANLLTNAAKYTPPRSTIELSARREGPEVVITVRDDGPGIQPDLLPRIFDLFVQGQRTIERAEGGLGLGLSLVKNLVELHGGSVGVSNRPSGGAEFLVRLPALERPAPKAAPRPELPAQARKPRRVLVVDDNEDAADLLSEVLRGLGHEVRVAHDGPQALDELRRFPAEVGLLDIGLPVMDGFELARRIREGGDSGVRLIAVTGYGLAHDRESARSAGFDRHLTKPVDLDELLRAIEAV